MDKVLNLYKLCGETPLECILRYKKDNPEFENVKMTYAGRLDPLAEGVLIVLAGDAVYRKEEFLNMKKEYVVEVLFGMGTDTYDVLGMSSKVESSKVIKLDAEETLKKFIGKNIFEYPSYSSKPVNGVPLFSLARSGELENVEMPTKEIEIYNLEIVNWREVNSKELLNEILKKIESVKGDFRQSEIMLRWKEFLEKTDCNFQIAKIKAEVSSGTYMRTLAYEWGKALGLPALAYHIVRTKVDKYKAEEGI